MAGGYIINYCDDLGLNYTILSYQIKVVADANKNAAILYFSAICDSESEEKLSPTGDRIGDYAVTLGVCHSVRNPCQIL